MKKAPEYDRSQKKLQRILELLKPKVLVRLTYPSKYPSLSETLVHIDTLVRFLTEQGHQGIWFRRLQTRGVPFFYLLLSKFIPVRDLSQKWFTVVGSGDPAHLKAGVDISSFQFKKGYMQFLEKEIFPLIHHSDFCFCTFGSLKAKLISWF